MKNDLKVLNEIFISVSNGSTEKLTFENIEFINSVSFALFNVDELDDLYLDIVETILLISNILYNNTDRSLLPLEDGVYDLLVIAYSRYRSMGNIIGGAPILFENTGDTITKNRVFKKAFLEVEDISGFMFKEDIVTYQKRNSKDYSDSIRSMDGRQENKKTLTVEHMYDELSGTLDKCKFVLNTQAIERGVYDDANVQIFERDFIGKHIQLGVLSPTRIFTMILELKYDGIAIEAEVSNKIITARTRGDVSSNKAADLTPVFGGFEFSRAPLIEDTIGVQFEAIITTPNLYSLPEDKSYKNPRNAVIGLLSSLDSYMYRDYITLMPIKTSISDQFNNRVAEMEFLSKYYSSEELPRYAVITGNYVEILFLVNKFVQEAEALRPLIPFMYDGVVASYVDRDLVDMLGRQDFVNKYSMAIKFNPQRKQTVFIGYTYTVGQNGVITPMIHYNPIEFFGGIHTKSSGHSYKRFCELGLRYGDVITVEYTNDVMPYVIKDDISQNMENTNPVIEFITNCPACGSLLALSESGKSLTCMNIECSARVIARMTSTFQKIGIKDFSEESVRALYEKVSNTLTFKDIMNLTKDEIIFLGDLNSQKLVDQIDTIKTEPVYDYILLGSLGFTSIAIEKWKTILTNVILDDIVHMNSSNLFDILKVIKGIGESTIMSIINEREYFKQDLLYILSMPNLVRSIGQVSKKSIRYSGVRDLELMNFLIKQGYDASDGNVTKTTNILLIPYDGYTSSKTAKVGDDTLILSVDEFKNNINKYL